MLVPVEYEEAGQLHRDQAGYLQERLLLPAQASRFGDKSNLQHVPEARNQVRPALQLLLPE